MMTWVVYDISNDRVRGRVAKMCKEYGLYRVQKSAFLGDLNKNETDELLLRCKDIVDGEDDRSMCSPCATMTIVRCAS